MFRKRTLITFIVILFCTMAGFTAYTGCSHEESATVTIYLGENDTVSKRDSSFMGIVDSFLRLFTSEAEAGGWTLAYNSIKLFVQQDDITLFEINIPPTSNSYTLEVPAGKDITFTVVAYINGVKNCGRSLTTDVESGSEIEIQIKMLPIPLVTSASGSSMEINVGWENVSTATGYYLYRSLSPDGPYSLIATRSVNSYADTATVYGTEYYYRVQMYNSNGVGILSDYKSGHKN